MNTVAIVGVGLIGGSFGLALRENGFSGDLIGVSSAPALKAGLEAGAITCAASLAEAAQSADLIYLAQPVDRILTTLEKLEGLVKPDALVTDAGSTKQAIVERASTFLSTAHFLGGHPMAGKEQRGAEAAEANLFRGRRYVLTPHRPESEASRNFRAWLLRIGANVLEMSPQEHDRTVAFTSHLPQVISTALAVTLSREGNSRFTDVFGPGLLDMTRLATSAPELWLSILSTNRASIFAALEAFESSIQDVYKLMGDVSLTNFFEEGVRYATSVRNPAPKL